MKIDVKHLWKTKKKLIIGITAGVTAAAIGCGLWYQAGHSSKEPVYVFPFQYVGMTEYWGDSRESYGPVTTDKIQTVFLSDTQTVTEILVQAGDTVKKGDLLMTFDTTLSDLQLERKRLDVEKQKLQLEDAKAELRNLNSMKPMVIPDISDEEEETDTGSAITERIYPSTGDPVNRVTYDGSSAQKALIYWIKGSTQISDGIFRAADEHAAKLRELNPPAPSEPTEPSQPSEPSTPTEPSQPSEPSTPTEPSQPSEPSTPTEPSQPSEPSTPTEPSQPSEPSTPTEPSQPSEPSTPTEPSQPSEPSTPTEPSQPSEPSTPTESSEPSEPSTPSEQEQSSASAVSTPSLPDGTAFYVVIKVSANDMTLGEKKVWQCLKVTKSGGNYSFQFADTLIPDYSLLEFEDEDTPDDSPDVDFGSGYTAAQLAQLRSDQQKKIKELELSIKMADAEYKIMQKEISDGNIYADNDGKVVSLLTEEEAKQTRQPILKVSGGGGFNVEGFVSELEKANMKIGQEVTVNDWNTGMTYTGTVQSIGDFPSQNGYYNGSGNPNASYYPFQVFVDESADLQAGSYVSVMYGAAESQNGIYLENPFLRTEKGKSYVYILGQNGKLEQRWVTTGKSLWGSYTEILDGLTAEDLIAFPYGKNVKPGVAAMEGDLSNLYG